MTALSAPLAAPEELNRLYHDDYSAFFDRWEAQARVAEACRRIDSTARFLTEALEMLGNAEVTESNAAVIERLCIEKPDCLLGALNSLPTHEQERAIRFFIAAPLYRERSEIEDALRPYWEKGKYRGLYERFITIQENG